MRAGSTASVYILANQRRTVTYVGVTGDLERRLDQHRRHEYAAAFTRRYNVDRLVYVEATPNIAAAIAREKEIKRWRREKKIALIESRNPEWRDLSAECEWTIP
jgi:putative endonuclease